MMPVVLSLRRAFGACAEHHDAGRLADLHIRTPAEEAAAEILGSGRSLVLTGNPGDGKTHLLAVLAPRIPSGVEVVRDANEISGRRLAELLAHAHSGKVRVAVAVNRGVLLDSCERARGRARWADELAATVADPFVAESAGEGTGGITALDLSLRDNLHPSTVHEAVRRLACLALTERSAPARLHENADALLDPAVTRRVASLLRAVGGAGHHATMRDLLAFLAHMLAGGPKGRVAKYHANAFAGGQGPLFDGVRALDPLRVTSPFLDERLYAGDDGDGEWFRPDPDGRRSSEDLDAFVTAKRRALFEHRDGESLIRPPPPDALAGLAEAADPVQAVVRALNRYFDPSDRRDDRLALWVGHRYDARPPDHLASDRSVPTSALEAEIPRLPRRLAAAFGERAPERLTIRLREAPEAARITIGRDLAGVLEPGGAASGNAAALTKVWAFYDRLAFFASPEDTVRTLRLSDMSSIHMRVDTSSKRYLMPGCEV